MAAVPNNLFKKNNGIIILSPSVMGVSEPYLKTRFLTVPHFMVIAEVPSEKVKATFSRKYLRNHAFNKTIEKTNIISMISNYHMLT